jgi:hypothetical protein
LELNQCPNIKIQRTGAELLISIFSSCPPPILAFGG